MAFAAALSSKIGKNHGRGASKLPARDFQKWSKLLPSAVFLMSKRKITARLAVIFLKMACLDEKDAKSSVVRKERNVCKGNLSRIPLAFQFPRRISLRSKLAPKRNTTLMGGVPFWWTRRDSNPRPLGCEPNALPTELRAQTETPEAGSCRFPLDNNAIIPHFFLWSSMIFSFRQILEQNGHSIKRSPVSFPEPRACPEERFFRAGRAAAR